MRKFKFKNVSGNSVGKHADRSVVIIFSVKYAGRDPMEGPPRQ